MRQAVLDFDSVAMDELGFGAFQEAGIVDIEVLSCDGLRGVARLRVKEQPDEQHLNESETIQWWEQIPNEETGYIYLVEGNTAETFEMKGIDAEQFPRTEEVNVHNWGFTMTYAGSSDQIRGMIKDLRATGFDPTLQKIQGYRIKSKPLDSLTDRQREVLETAFDRGYYDVPRSTSTKEIANGLGLDDSTVSEHLQRAEHNLLSTVLNRSG